MSYITWVLGSRGSPHHSLSRGFSLRSQIYHSAAPGRETGKEEKGKKVNMWVLSAQRDEGEWMRMNG